MSGLGKPRWTRSFITIKSTTYNVFCVGGRRRLRRRRVCAETRRGGRGICAPTGRRFADAWLMFHGKHLALVEKPGGWRESSARFWVLVAAMADYGRHSMSASGTPPTTISASLCRLFQTQKFHPRRRGIPAATAQLKQKAAMFPVKHRRWLGLPLARRAANYKRIGMTSQIVRSSPGCLRMQIPSLSCRCNSMVSPRQARATSMR